MLVLYTYRDYFYGPAASTSVRTALTAFVIAAAVTAKLATCAFKLSVGRDWLVEIASGSATRLASE